MTRFLGFTCLALWFTACGSDSHDSDLPPGWETAERVEELSQAPCGASALRDDIPEELGWSAADSGLTVAYDHAHFRCEQDVEAFVRRGSDALDLLVQPIDMNPTAVAGCDCLYDVTLQVPAARGDYALTLYRRWDNVNRPNSPVKIGEAQISVE